MLAWVIAIVLAQQVAGPDYVAQFEAAAEALSAGDDSRAIKLLLAVAASNNELADDALFLAGQTLEEKLADPASAGELYQRLLKDYPDSRVALAAQKRLDLIRKRAPSAVEKDYLGEFTQIRREYRDDDPVPSIAAAEALLQSAGDWRGSDGVRIWLGQVLRRLGERRRALQNYLAAAEGSDDESFSARLYAAEMASELGDYAQAKTLLDQAPLAGDKVRSISVADARDRIDTRYFRRRWLVVCYVFAGLGILGLAMSLWRAAGSVARAATALRSPPIEVVCAAPLVAIIGIMAATDQPDAALAILKILGAGVVATWLSGSALRLKTSRWRSLAHAALAGIVVASVTYAAVFASGLMDLLIATVRFGPDV